eukprot:scaffold77792_cov48-Phaeocystis_antarctica.AAC.3
MWIACALRVRCVCVVRALRVRYVCVACILRNGHSCTTTAIRAVCRCAASVTSTVSPSCGRPGGASCAPLPAAPPKRSEPIEPIDEERRWKRPCSPLGALVAAAAACCCSAATRR